MHVQQILYIVTVLNISGSAISFDCECSIILDRPSLITDYKKNLDCVTVRGKRMCGITCKKSKCIFYSNI